MDRPSILVTGASGFIGEALCRALRASHHDVTLVTSADGDIADPHTLADLPGAAQVFHLAARTFVPDSWRDPAGFVSANVLGSVNVLEYCRKHRAQLTFVSGYLYGKPRHLPISETSPPCPNNPYALSKHLAEQECAFYASEFGLPVTVIRPFNVFGPGQKSHFLIPAIVRQLFGSKAIVVKDLEPRRDYIYIVDLVEALLRSMERPVGCRIINIGSGKSVSVRRLISELQAIVGTELPVLCEGQGRTNEIQDVYADITNAREMLGWRPQLTLRQGLELTVESCRPSGGASRGAVS